MNQKAMFGAGCFWGVESAFRSMKGVVNAAVGYSGGSLANPTYHDVCTGSTGHAEVVYIEYDPLQVTYGELLNLFWEIHDPTTLDRQGPDVGTQYRSGVYFYTDDQKSQAESSKKELEKNHAFQNPIVTEILPAANFYEAEEYHQKYFEKQGINPGCHIRKRR